MPQPSASEEILTDERLLEWRRERFAELGFSPAESSEPLAKRCGVCSIHARLAVALTRARAHSQRRPPEHRNLSVVRERGPYSAHRATFRRGYAFGPSPNNLRILARRLRMRRLYSPRRAPPTA